MRPLFAGALASCLIAALATASPARGAPLVRLAGTSPGPVPRLMPVIVETRLGGQIFGFDIDPDGTEGILSEAQTLGDGTVLAAVETFDQGSGEILGIVAQRSTQDDFLTLGVVGRHVGLVEYEHEVAFLDVERTFPTLDPLAANRFNGRWQPPIDDHHLIEAVSRNHATDTLVAYAYDNSESFQPEVFSSNLADGTFGPLIVMTDASFQTGLVPKLAYDESTKRRCSASRRSATRSSRRRSRSSMSATARRRCSAASARATSTVSRSIPRCTSRARRPRSTSACSSTT
jgi:hypothetical protein